MKRILVAVIIILLIGLYLLFFYPKNYAVPQLKERANTKYWNLPTGSRIAYTLLPAKGSRQPYPIVFLQGGPGGFITNRNIQDLSQLSNDGYDVYLYDQIGSGHSARLEEIRQYTAARHKADLEAIISQIGTEKVILLGQSWGAILAALYVAEHPEKVEKLILTGPGPLIPFNYKLHKLAAPDSLDMKKPVFTNRQAVDKVQNLRHLAVSFWAKRFLVKLAPDKEADDYQTLLNKELQKSTVVDTLNLSPVEAGGGYYAQLMTVLSFPFTQDPRPKLKDCQIPLLILKGQYDNQAWGYTQEYLDIFPNHKLVVINGAGHSISVEKPKEYYYAIRDFITNSEIASDKSP